MRWPALTTMYIHCEWGTTMYMYIHMYVGAGLILLQVRHPAVTGRIIVCTAHDIPVTTIFYNFFLDRARSPVFRHMNNGRHWIFIGVQYIQTRLLTGNRVRICRMEWNSQGEMKKWWGQRRVTQKMSYEMEDSSHFENGNEKVNQELPIMYVLYEHPPTTSFHVPLVLYTHPGLTGRTRACSSDRTGPGKR